MRINKSKLIMLITTLSMIIVGILVWNIFFNENYNLIDGTDMQNGTFDTQNSTNEMIDDKQFESDMKNRLVKKKINKEPIKVSDPRLAGVQEIFSVIEQPYEPPYFDKKKETYYYMSIDTFTGAARYTNGIVINQDGKVTNYDKVTEGGKKYVYIDSYQIIPLVRTLVQELTELTDEPFSNKENLFKIMIRITDLQKHLERIDLIDLSSVFIEINTYIDRDQASYDKAVKLIKEINSLVNLD